MWKKEKVKIKIIKMNKNNKKKMRRKKINKKKNYESQPNSICLDFDKSTSLNMK